MESTRDVSARSGKTGLDSQIALSVDWLRLALYHTNEDNREHERLLPLFEQVFSCSFQVSTEPHTWYHHKWDGQASSPAGIHIRWRHFDPMKLKPGQFRVDLSGGACKSVEHEDLRDFAQLLAAGYGARCGRIDAALDDFGKSLWTWDEVKDASDRDNYALVRSSRIVTGGKRGEKKGVTVYFGSRESEAYYRFYDKFIESAGLIDSNRCEVEFKDTKADNVFQMWIGADTHEAAKEALMSALTGSIKFVDRSKDDPNLDRLPVLSWWQKVCQLAVSQVRVPGKRVEQTIEKTMDFFARISGSLYAVKRVMGESFEIWAEAILESGKANQKSHHDALVETAMARASMSG